MILSQLNGLKWYSISSATNMPFNMTSSTLYVKRNTRYVFSFENKLVQHATWIKHIVNRPVKQNNAISTQTITGYSDKALA